ncbi:hypothetical protein [Microbacterium sp. SA39]|uniref:hypothetical protein n=1 Tax=Microbacterium sp. SA39 TaxID=1263625 RepID=UPI0005F9B44F|nr:hypothetical protein [Microbacterium sp. SA39]KJQ55056.1 hypothetical protein RS85_01115 [Microbacterium sp. SA39]
MISAHLSPVAVDGTTGMVAVVTLLAALVLGLGTLARPSRATVTWGVAFAVSTLAAYLWLAGHHGGDGMLRAAASGLLLSFEPLIWLGLRQHRGRKGLGWVAIAFAVLCTAVLVAASGTPWYLLAFHLGFLVSGAFAALVAYELFRDDRVARDITLPLALASAGFAIVSVVTAGSALQFADASVEEQLGALRGINSVGTLIVGTCAAFTLLLMVRAVPPTQARSDGAASSARARLQKARAQGDASWAVLDIRLDDPRDLREASTGPAFAVIVDRFHADVEQSVPDVADVDAVDQDRAVVLVPGSDEEVRDHIRAILTAVSDLDGASPVHGIRASASIGWARVSSVGYDYDALVSAAAEAALRARADGGDGWKRAAVADPSITVVVDADADAPGAEPGGR